MAEARHRRSLSQSEALTLSAATRVRENNSNSRDRKEKRVGGRLDAPSDLLLLEECITPPPPYSSSFPIQYSSSSSSHSRSSNSRSPLPSSNSVPVVHASSYSSLPPSTISGEGGDEIETTEDVPVDMSQEDAFPTKIEQFRQEQKSLLFFPHSPPASKKQKEKEKEKEEELEREIERELAKTVSQSPRLCLTDVRLKRQRRRENNENYSQNFPPSTPPSSPLPPLPLPFLPSSSTPVSPPDLQLGEGEPEPSSSSLSNSFCSSSPSPPSPINLSHSLTSHSPLQAPLSSPSPSLPPRLEKKSTPALPLSLDLPLSNSPTPTPPSPPCPYLLSGEMCLLEVKCQTKYIQKDQIFVGEGGVGGKGEVVEGGEVLMGVLHLTNYRYIFLPSKKIEGTVASPLPGKKNTLFKKNFGNLRKMGKGDDTFNYEKKRSSDGRVTIAGREEKTKGEDGVGGDGWKEVWEGAVSKIQTFKKSKNGVTIFQKDGFVVTFVFSSEERVRMLCEHLEPRVFPDHCVKVFAFLHRPLKYTFPIVCDLEAEYQRLGFPKRRFCIDKTLNANFTFCSTYPSVLVFPSGVSGEMLEGVARFRSRKRIPVATFYWKPTGACLFRSSQPLVGIKNNRSRYDEEYLFCLRNKGQPRLVIMDSRPKTNARANRLGGGGYESKRAYKCVTTEFQDIENIHVVRNSLLSLRSGYSIGSGSSEGQWLRHISLILSSAREAGLRLLNSESVLIHCSDGWDRTAQTISLVELLMDSYYRTIRGFAVLIEKEFCAFGHQFARRHGHGFNIQNPRDSQRSPIFTQFCDCVVQLLRQFPTSFEFTESLLIFILEHVYSCRFGNFLFDNERQRKKADIQGQTVSIWSVVFENCNTFKNPLYKPEDPSPDPSTPTGCLDLKNLQVGVPQLLPFREYHKKTLSGAQFFAKKQDLSKEIGEGGGRLREKRQGFREGGGVGPSFSSCSSSCESFSSYFSSNYLLDEGNYLVSEEDS